MPNLPTETLLGREVAYPDSYAPQILTPIPRQRGVAEWHAGEDVWNAWELSWLDAGGKPKAAVGVLRVPADSPNLVESKSLKLYLNSLNQVPFSDLEDVRLCIEKDLCRVIGKAVCLSLLPLQGAGAEALDVMDPETVRQALIQAHGWSPEEVTGGCLDDGAMSPVAASPEAFRFSPCEKGGVCQAYYSHLLKTNCPVTGQPDWASIWVLMKGAVVVPADLLGYLVSYRDQRDFHEQCVERIFTDLKRVTGAEELTVVARYTRRGGLDINPWRSTRPIQVPNSRSIRQ